MDLRYNHLSLAVFVPFSLLPKYNKVFHKKRDLKETVCGISISLHENMAMADFHRYPRKPLSDQVYKLYINV